MSRRRARYSRGHWQVERERHALTDPVPAAPIKETEPLAGVVAGIMKKLGLADQHWMVSLCQRWADIVGADVAGHSRPGRLNHGALIVFVDTSVWLSELSRYGRQRILTNLQQRYDPACIRSVDFQLDPEATDHGSGDFLSRWKNQRKEP